MPPAWFDKLFQRPQAGLLASTSKSSLISSTASISDEQSMMIESETSTRLEASAVPRIFALVVAIDRYKNKTDLTGCRNDGERFINFLTGMLGVPPSQIVFLADEKATRGEILKQFDQFLMKNTDIQRDDAIIFFFAGHGSRLDAPPGWVTDSNKIEALCPHDVRTIGEDGEEVWDIPDRTIDVLMRKLASEKGDNILAVFDCCHSGGLARAEKTLRVRSIPPPPYPPPADLDREIWSSVPEPDTRAAHTVIQSGFQYKAMASHVLLTACGPDELAMEDPTAKDAPGGLFTTALIECLRRCSLHDTTYAGLFETLDLKQKNQHPQCEGTNKNRLLFSVNTIRDGETMFKVSKKKNKLWVSAGGIHGVVEGTEFIVRSFERTFNLKARKVGAFETVLEGSHNITDGRAIVSHWNHPTLRVCSSIPYSSVQVMVVPADEPADIALHRVESGTWELERFDTLIPTYSGRSIRFDADIKRMGDIFDAIANFNSCLYRSAGAAANFAGKVKMRLNRIGIVRGEFGPVGDDLLEDPHSSHSGVNLKEAIITDLDSRYSFTLENSSDVDLFPYFFYFDPSDYSVQSWYKPPSPTTPAPLKRIKPDGTPSLFAFGYGGFGTDPIEFYLPPGHQTDTGFLKVFLTTTYVDMTNVSQSPISEVSSPSRGLMYTLKGAWACETFVLTCRNP